MRVAGWVESVTTSNTQPVHPKPAPGTPQPAASSEPTAPARIPRAGLLVLAAAGFTAVTTELLPSGLLPEISRELGVGESAVGSLTAVYAAVIVFTALPLSRLLAGRVQRKTLLVAAVFTFAVSNVVLALSPGLPLAIGARLLGGVAHGLLWSGMAPYVARIVPAHSVGKAMAIVFSGNSIALAVGAPLGTMMGALLSWRTSFVVLAVVAALLGLLAIRLLPAAKETGPGSTPSLRAALKVRGVIAVAVAWPLLVLAHFTLFTYIAPFLLTAGLPANAVSISLSVIGVASLVGIWIAGITTDSLPRRSLLVTVAGLLGVFALLPVLGGNWLGAMALLALWGIAFGAIGIYNQAAILRAGGEHKDAANSLTVVTIQLGIAVGASYGAVAFTIMGPGLVPLAAAVPVAAALAIIVASRKGGYPAGPGETR